MASKLTFTEYKGTSLEFLKDIGVGEHNMAALKKPRGRKMMYFWWESKDKWFMNLADGPSSGPNESSVWITADDMPKRLDWHMQSGYELYLVS